MKRASIISHSSKTKSSPSSGSTTKSPTQRQRILELLRARGRFGATNVDLVALKIFRYSSRLRELRQQNFCIDTVRVTEGLYKYILRSEPDTPKALPSFERKSREQLTPSLFPPATGRDGRP